MKPELDNTFCWHPFKQMALKDWDKAVGIKVAAPCCNSMRFDKPDPMNIRDKLKETPHEIMPKELFYGEEFTELRKSLLAGERHSACDTCWEMEDRGVKSYRLKHNPIYKEDYINNPKLTTLDISFGENCNLRCRICFPGTSNKLRKDYRFFKENKIDTTGIRSFDWKQDDPYTLSMHGDPGMEHAMFQWKTDSPQWKNILDNIDTITHIKATGGETTISSGFLEFVDTAIQRDCAKNMTLEFHSNCTKFTNKLVDKIGQFKCVIINCSIDSYGDNYHYMRYPMQWDKLTVSLENLLGRLTNADIRIGFNPVISVLNWHRLQELYNYQHTLAQKYKHIRMEFFVDNLSPHTKFIHLKFLPKHLKQKVITYLEQIHTDNRTNIKTTVLPIIQYLEHFMDFPVTDVHKHNMLREITAFDKSRNQNYKDYLHSSLVDYLEEPAYA